MDLKQKFEDYTEQEYLTLINKIWAVDATELEHDQLVMHFDKLSQHPMGADLLFYSMDYGNRASPESIVASVKQLRAFQGMPGFKNAPQPETGLGSGGLPGNASLVPANNGVAERKAQRQTYAASRSTRFANEQKIAEQLDRKEQAADEALNYLDSLLNAAQVRALTEQPSIGSEQRLVALEKEVESIESAKSNARIARGRIKGTQMRAKFAQDRAQSDVKYPSRSRPVEELQAALQNITQINQQHLSRWTAIEQYNLQLQERTAAFLWTAEEKLTRLQVATGREPANTASTFLTSIANAAAGPLIMAPVAEAMAVFDEFLPDLQATILSAVAMFTRMAAAEAAGTIGKYATVLRFANKLGNGERYAFSLPLSELAPLESHDWENIARVNGEVKLPFRVGSGIVNWLSLECKQIYIAPTDNLTVPGNVRVRAATWDPQKLAYSFTSEGSAPTTLLWTRADAPSFDPSSVATSKYTGTMNTPNWPQVEAFPVIDDIRFDDYIICFPTASNLAPMYVMFKDRRDYPGIASGDGMPISMHWLDAVTTDGGVPIPSHIADQLRGRFFKRFDAFKAAFWKAVEADPALNAQFNAENQALMRNGSTPFSERAGSQKPFSIQHKSAVSAGGAVYNMDNMSIKS